MGECDYPDMIRALDENYIVRKPLQDQPPHAPPARCSCRTRRRNGIAAQQIHGSMNSDLEVPPESSTLLFVPFGRPHRLFRGIRVNADCPHQLGTNCCRILRTNSAGSIDPTAPSSICWSRRNTSASHASATPASGLPSRLDTRSWASSARSDSLSSSALLRSWTNAALFMCRPLARRSRDAACHERLLQQRSAVIPFCAGFGVSKSLNPLSANQQRPSPPVMLPTRSTVTTAASLPKDP